MKCYLEVGNACFCNCPMCDIHSKPHKKIEFEVFKNRVDKLKKAGFKTIRLAGNDPLTHPQIIDFIDYIENRRMKVDITTTLLTPNKELVERVSKVDTLRLSFSTIANFDRFYGVDKYVLFCKNFDTVCEIRKNGFIINYTFVESFKNYKYIDSNLLTRFLIYSPEFKGRVNFFPEIKYNVEWSQEEKENVENFIKDIKVPHEYFDFTLKKMTKCTIHNKHLYIKVNGDVYPCCMSGGEIGQDSVDELFLGNIDSDNIKEIMSKKLENLNNYICDKCTPKFFNNM